MSALITGASGFLGGRLAQVLAGRGEKVALLVRPGAELGHLARLPVTMINGALSDSDALERAVRGVTHIYHCAACSSDWAPLGTFREANISGVRNLLAAAAKVPGLERFVHVSTTDVYGYPAVPCDESHAPVDVGLPYNSTKVEGERCVREAGLNGMPVTIVRPATIYGPRGKDFVVTIAGHLRSGTMASIDGGRATGGFAYVDNVVDAMIDAGCSANTIGRIYNISDGTGASWREYVAALASGLGLRRPWIDLPSSLATPMARGMEAVHSALRLPGRPLLTRHAVMLLSRDQEFPTGAAVRDFGFTPKVSLEEGIARSVAWLRSIA